MALTYAQRQFIANALATRIQEIREERNFRANTGKVSADFCMTSNDLLAYELLTLDAEYTRLMYEEDL